MVGLDFIEKTPGKAVFPSYIIEWIYSNSILFMTKAFLYLNSTSSHKLELYPFLMNHFFQTENFLIKIQLANFFYIFLRQHFECFCCSHSNLNQVRSAIKRKVKSLPQTLIHESLQLECVNLWYYKLHVWNFQGLIDIGLNKSELVTKTHSFVIIKKNKWFLKPLN